MKNNQTLFEQGDSRLNACLDNYMGFFQLSDYYLKSANALIEESVADRSKLDVYIYSAVFLYRHSVELQLKELVWMSNSLLGEGKNFPYDHRLMEMWNTIEKNSKALLASDFPLDKTEAHYIKETLQEIRKHDPKSDSFRYPVGKKKQRSHPGLIHINVKVLYERFNQIHEYLGRLSWMIEHLYMESDV